MRYETRQRARQRLDERLTPLKPEDRFLPPPKGWIKAIREALGMSGLQLANRLHVKPQAVDALERSEAADTIQLSTLRRAAEAMDCRLVYALVPNSSLTGAVNERARKIALRDLGRVAHTMALEAQATGAADIEERVESYIRHELRERDVWNEP